MHCPELQIRIGFGQAPERHLDQVRARNRTCKRPRHGNANRLRRIESDEIANVGKRHEAFQLVISVRPLAEHAQGQVYFGGCKFFENGHECETRLIRKRALAAPVR